MNINQNVSLSKTAATVQSVASSKSSASASAVPAPAVASPARLPSTTGDFDAVRVAEIRESIRAGSYQVDTAKIADGLISSVRDLLGKGSS